MLTWSNLVGIPRVVNPNNPVDVDYVLDRFQKYRYIGDKRKLPPGFRWYGRASYAQDALKARGEFTLFVKVADQIPGAQAHVADTYAPTFGHVIFVIGFHYPVASFRKRPMQLDDDYSFCEPSLRLFADIWIAILFRNGFN